MTWKLRSFITSSKTIKPFYCHKDSVGVCVSFQIQLVYFFFYIYKCRNLLLGEWHPEACAYQNQGAQLLSWPGYGVSLYQCVLAAPLNVRPSDISGCVPGWAASMLSSRASLPNGPQDHWKEPGAHWFCGGWSWLPPLGVSPSPSCCLFLSLEG